MEYIKITIFFYNYYYLAMPEGRIGFFVDAGASYFLT